MIREIIIDIVTSVFGARIEAGVAYRARVVSQASSGLLELVPDNKRIPGLTDVPIRYGVPGARAKVKAGAICFVEFVEGDFSKPIVTGWEPGACEEITLDATKVRLADGDRKLARIGDLVAMQLPPGANTGGAVLWTMGTEPPSPVGKAYGVIVSGTDKATAP